MAGSPRDPLSVPPSEPPPPGVSPDADAVRLVALEDHVRSLKRIVAGAVALALAAAALGLIAILTDDRGGNVSSADLARIDERLDRLERQARQGSQPDANDIEAALAEKADSSDVRGLRQDVERLRRSMEQSNADAQAAATGVDELERRLDDLEQRLTDLENASSGQQQP